MTISALILFGIMSLGNLYVPFSPRERPLPEVRLKIAAGIDRSYFGRYLADPRFDDLMRELEQIRFRAIDRVGYRTGLELPDTENLIVKLSDSNRPANRAASIRPVRSDGREINLVTLSSRQLVDRRIDVEASLVHEFIHAAMRELMGDDR